MQDINSELNHPPLNFSTVWISFVMSLLISFAHILSIRFEVLSFCAHLILSVIQGSHYCYLFSYSAFFPELLPLSLPPFGNCTPKFSRSVAVVGGTFHDPQWMPETMNSTKPYILFFFLLSIPMLNLI